MLTHQETLLLVVLVQHLGLRTCPYATLEQVTSGFCEATIKQPIFLLKSRTGVRTNPHLGLVKAGDDTVASGQSGSHAAALMQHLFWASPHSGSWRKAGPQRLK